MKKTRAILILALVASLGILVPARGAFSQQTAGELFEKALYVEEAQGDLQKAIGIYQDIVKRFPENRDVAAKALLHIGMCHEKLGSQEALKAYERLIADYPGQKEEVALAKERLAGLVKIAAPAPRKPLFRKIRTPFSIPQWSGSRLSPDGKILAFGSQNLIWTVPIPGKVDPDLAGESKELPGGADVLGDGLSWSGDGRWIAFSRAYFHVGATRILFRPEGAYIDVIPSSGGEPKRIPVPQWVATKGDTQRRLSLSPDGKTVAFDSGGQIYVASVDTGNIKQVTKDGGVAPCFSPDGTKIAYLTPPVSQDNPPARLHEVWVISADGQDPVKVSGDLRENLSQTGPTWSPDGKKIAFVSKGKIWVVPAEGGEPAEVKTDVDADAGKLDWSPDGRKIAFSGDSGMDIEFWFMEDFLHLLKK